MTCPHLYCKRPHYQSRWFVRKHMPMPLLASSFERPPEFQAYSYCNVNLPLRWFGVWTLIDSLSTSTI